MSHPPEAGLISAVTPKLPDFWPHNADAWLLQVEAQFRISKIVSSQTKFDLTVQKLDEATVCRLLDLLKNPPVDNPYEALKARLEQGFMKSPYQRLTDFDNLPQLGDRRPSEMLDSILAALSGIDHDPTSCPHVRFAFLKRLPTSIRATLTSFDDLSLRDLALKADVTWSTCGAVQDTAPTVTAVQSSSRDSRRPANRRQTPGRAASPSSSTSPSRAGDYCYFHSKFGAKARGCVAPCAWPGNASAGGRCN